MKFGSMYGMNDNQNNSAFMAGRTTSRVMRPPGGKSSVQLGWDSSPGGSNKAVSSSSSSFKKEVVPKKDDDDATKMLMMQVKGDALVANGNAKGKENGFDVADGALVASSSSSNNNSSSRSVSSNVYANGSSQNTGNVITDRPSYKVTQPPGGKSSISFY